MKFQEGLENIKLNIQRWGWQKGSSFKAKVHELNYFFWEVTQRCNLSCLHCGSECDISSSVPELPADKVLEVFQNIAQHYDAKKIMVAITGGEPLVREDLFEILSKVSEMGFPWGMVTNGMLVNEQTVLKCIQSGMRTVSVSLDGLQDTHNWLRNNEQSFDRVIKALQLFNNCEKLSAVEAITCVNERNITQLNEIYQLLQGVGIRNWRLFTIFPKGRATQNPELIINKRILTSLFEFIQEKRLSDTGLRVSYSEEGYPGCEWERKIRDDFSYCGAGINVGSLLCDGSYSACPSLGREWIQGHVDELDFTTAWETRYEDMRNRDFMKSGSCKQCSEWKHCKGSSLHLWNMEQQKTRICHYELLHRD